MSESVSIDRFEIRAILGRGATGTLFRAFDPDLGRLVALRQLSAEVTGDSDRFERVQRSAARVAGIADPNVVEVFNLVTESHPPLLVTEYVAGPSAQHVIGSSGRQDPAWAFTASAGAIDGLARLHSLGLVHGYLTPSTILFDSYGNSKIANVGLGGGGNFDSEELMFLAPEVLAGSTPTCPTDVFALAAVFSALLSGRAPFPAQNLGQALSRRQQRPMNLGELPPAIAAALASAMSREPKARPTDIAGFGADLRALAESELGVDWRLVGAGGLTATVAAAVATGAVLIPDAIAAATATFAAGAGAASASAAGAVSSVGAVAAGHAAAGVAHGSAAVAGQAGAAVGTAGGASTGTAAGSTGIMSALAAKPVVAATVATVAVAGGGTTAYVVTKEEAPKVAAPVCAGIPNCTVVAQVDVDGDGLPDQVGMYGTGALKDYQGSNWTTRVTTAAGQQSSITKRVGPIYDDHPAVPGTPWYGSGRLTGQPGANLVIEQSRFEGFSVWAFVWTDGRLEALAPPVPQRSSGNAEFVDVWTVFGYPAGGIDYLCLPNGTIRVDDETSDPEGTVRTVATNTFSWTAGRWQRVGPTTAGTPRSDRHGFSDCGDLPKLP